MAASQHLKKLDLDAGRLAFAAANDDRFAEPGITRDAGFEKRRAAKIIARGIGAAALRQCGHRSGGP